MSLLLKNVLVYDTTSKWDGCKTSLLIKDERISQVGDRLEEAGVNRILDMQGAIACPGWFDLNADFCDPGKEYREGLASGISMAAKSGFTDVHIMPNTDAPIDQKSDVLYYKRNNIPIDIHVSAAVSEGLKGEELTEMMDLYVHGRAASFSDGDKEVWNSELLLKALQYAASINAPIFQIARDNKLARATHMHEGVFSTHLGLRGEPSLSEELCLRRDLEILKYSGGRLHFAKISSGGGVDLIRKAKRAGLAVTCDVGLHHLLFTDEHIGFFDTQYKSDVPYRTEADRQALLEGLKDGTIDAICSNHRPVDDEGKNLEFDLAEPGNISIQTFWSGLLQVASDVDLSVLLKKVYQRPREILGHSQYTIQEGAFAKLTLLDKEPTWRLDANSNLSKSRNTPFWETELKGKVLGIVNGYFDNLENG